MMGVSLVRLAIEVSVLCEISVSDHISARIYCFNGRDTNVPDAEWCACRKQLAEPHGRRPIPTSEE
jgi:hypothetical protein